MKPVQFYRVIFTARNANAIFVLHALQKKTPRASRRDIDIAKLDSTT